MKPISTSRAENQIALKKPLLTQSEAIQESSRCLFCYSAPCITACPTGINIPQFIKRIQEDNLQGSATTILESNILGFSCARVCPVEVLCEGACVYNNMDEPPIQIGRLQEYATHYFHTESSQSLKKATQKTKYKVALIGAGPASLSCAAYLALSGVQATVFDARDYPGGLNAAVIAPYKLKLDEAVNEALWIESLGVEFKLGQAINADAAQQLTQDYDAVFVGTGLGADSRPLDSENAKNVLGATEWIERMKTQAVDLSQIQNAVVIGGGNTALDVVQELQLLGVQNVHLAYRRSKQDMSGYEHELLGALQKGVIFHPEYQPLKIIVNQGVAVAVQFKTPSGEQTLAADCVILATGQKKRSVADGLKLTTNEHGHIVVDQKTMQTSNSKIYAGGDCINGGKEVVNAVYDGREAAHHMLQSWNLKVQYGRFQTD